MSKTKKILKTPKCSKCGCTSLIEVGIVYEEHLDERDHMGLLCPLCHKLNLVPVDKTNEN